MRRVAQCDVCFTRNHRRFFRLLGGCNRRVNFFRVMTVNFLNVPAGGLKAHHLICAIRQLNRAIDGDVVVVPKHDQFAQLMTSCNADRFLADTFH